MKFFLILLFIFFVYSDNLPAKEKKGQSVIMEETKITGDIEKPEFINIIKRRRVEFEDKEELNRSFKNEIFKPLIKNNFEDNYSDEVKQILEQNSITIK